MRITGIGRFGLDMPKISLLMLLALTAAIFEGFGMAMFLPLLEFVEKGPVVLEQSSGLWRRLLAGFDFLGIEPGLFPLLVVVLILQFMRIIAIYVRQVYTAWLQQSVLHVTRSNLFKSYINSRYDFFDHLSTGHMVNLMTTETQRVGGYYSSLFNLVANLAICVGFIAVLIWISPQMTALALLFFTLGGLAVTFIVRNTTRYSYKSTDSNKEFSFLIVERLAAFRLIKLSAVGEREVDRVKKASQEVRNNLFVLKKLNARVDSTIEPIVVCAGVLIFFGAVRFFGMSLSEIGLFMVILLRLLPLVKEVLKLRQACQSVLGSLDAVSCGMDQAAAAKEVLSGYEGRDLRGISKEIRFEDVWFRYAGSTENALKGINLSIEAGRMTALVGPSGGGKSTLADLLPQLRVPTKGRVLFDGVPASEFDPDSLRRSIAFVSQDAAMLKESVRFNVAFSSNGADDNQIWDALKKAKADDFVRSLPEGLDTVLGERGYSLSGGQRQRLSLARALLEKAPILILDEPTSALDSESEREIQAAIKEMRESGRHTIIIIAHRLSTIRDADKIVVLEGGRITQVGKHEELMIDQHWYAMIQDMQSSGDKH